jgi:chromosomal replication initiator protein
MQGIGHTLLARGEGPILFCSGEEFTNDLVEGIRLKSTEKVRSKYRRVKLLLIDDVQFIAGKATVQEEFFHTFNAIGREGGQVVMTSDKPPAEIARLEERLRSRFGAGMIVDVGPADFEMRTAILLIKAKQKKVNLPMETAQAIAANTEGVRELEGVLIKLLTEAEVTGQPISMNMAEQVMKISQSRSGTAKVVTPTEVIQLVSDYFGVGVAQIKGERRTKTIVVPRQILMYLLRFDLRLPFEEVGRLVGGRDHSTVMHAADKIKVQMERDEMIKNQVGQLRNKLLGI